MQNSETDREVVCVGVFGCVCTFVCVCVCVYVRACVLRVCMFEREMDGGSGRESVCLLGKDRMHRQTVAVRCSVLKCVAVCCSVLARERRNA